MSIFLILRPQSNSKTDNKFREISSDNKFRQISSDTKNKFTQISLEKSISDKWLKVLLFSVGDFGK